MPRVLVSDTLSEQGLAILRGGAGMEVDYRPGLTEAELAVAIRGADALVIRSGSKVTASVLAEAARLKVVGRAGIGVDNVDVAAASRRGIVVMNTPTGNAVTTAEHAVALLMSLARMIPEASRTLKAGKWDRKRFEGVELANKTLAVIGLGNIGRIVANRAKGLNMKIIGFDPVMNAEHAAALGVELCSLEAIWPRADAVTVHTPLTPETRGIVHAGMLSKLKKGVLLVNAARGGIYDEAALLEGLVRGTIGGVALDVFVEEPPPKDHPLLAHERVIATPHLGASTREAQDRVAIEIAAQVVSYLERGAIKNAVNVPSVSSEGASKLAPWLLLAYRLGRFVAGIASGPVESVEIDCAGEPAQLAEKMVGSSALAGLLRGWEGAEVNQVAARPVAAERGLLVRDLITTNPHADYAHAVTVRVKTSGGVTHAVAGTLAGDRTPRLTRWGDFEIEAPLGGDMLVVTSLDVPGVVGFLGTTLGAASINIARVHLGAIAFPKPPLQATAARGDTSARRRAVSVWALDQAIPASVLETLRRSPDVESALALQV